MEIICVGNELLIGKTLNTNATWLARRVTSLGLMVKRIVVVGDELDEIAGTLQETLRRKPDFIITTGGLGPTFDDKTLEGIARGLNRRLEVNGKALEMVREKYVAYLKKKGKTEKVELTPPRVKMATLPEGTRPLPNPVGTAPGVIAIVKGTFIIALPGVPPEMEAIFNGSIAEILKKKAGKSAFFETSIYADEITESNLAPLIDNVMHNNPYVYVKSHVYTKSMAQVEGERRHIELHFSTTADDPETAGSRLDKAVSELSELVRMNGGKISK
ncbi:MAG TPA: molybdopterin-binding protein [candidate division Zixibacteria bacterium]|nr:molybdopterin-binding protein [candidate division Zixibacteria bacterium]